MMPLLWSSEKEFPCGRAFTFVLRLHTHGINKSQLSHSNLIGVLNLIKHSNHIRDTFPGYIIYETNDQLRLTDVRFFFSIR